MVPLWNIFLSVCSQVSPSIAAQSPGGKMEGHKPACSPKPSRSNLIFALKQMSSAQVARFSASSMQQQFQPDPQKLF